MNAGLNSPTHTGVSQIGYLGLGVSDIKGWSEFAATVLGLQPNGESAEGDVFLRMDGHHHRLILTSDEADDLVFVGYQVNDATSLDRVAERLRSAGIEVSDGSDAELATRMVERLIKFSDPDGLSTEIYCGPLLDHTPFVSPRGVGSFVADELGFGHIVIGVSNTEQYGRYLTDVLGARISDYIAVPIGPMTLDITFLRVNPRHHSVAIMTPPPIPGAPKKRLQHMMIEADNIDAVGAALDLFNRHGLAAGALGRHTNDRMLSFYAETPSGFHIEYGHGGLLVDEETWSVTKWRAPSLWGHSMPRPTPPS